MTQGTNSRNMLPSYKRRFSTGGRRALLSGGAVLTFLATSEDTNGQFAMFEAWGIPGMEPPPHTHIHEDETYYLLEGSMWFRVGDKEFTAERGDFVFLPRKVQHEFKVLSESFRCHVGLFPGALDAFFKQVSRPYEGTDIPAINTTPPSPEVMDEMIALNKKYGIY